MKKIMLSLAIMGTMLACKQQNEEEATAALGAVITADDAATIVQYDISSQTGGLNTLLTDATNLVYNRNNASYCGKSKDSTVTRNSNGTYPNYSFSFTQQWSWLLTCSTSKVPSSLAYKTTTAGQYKTPNTTSNDSGVGDLTISGLEVQKENYVINGTYTRNGNQTVGSSKSLTSELKLSSVNVQVNKTSLKVQSGGTASISITGKSSTGRAFTFTGTIKFNGNNSFTITINGKDYNITI